MRTLGSMLAETYASWLRSVSTCCGVEEKPRYEFEKPIHVLRDQPVSIPPPSAEPLWTSEQTYEKTIERERGRSFGQRSGSENSSRSKRRWLSRSSSSRRPQISNPSNFRHLQSDSPQYAAAQPRPRPVSFRPLQLSIYQPNNRLSSLLPYFDSTECPIATPPRAHTAGSRQWEDGNEIYSNDRSYSSLSFHVPRKHTREGSNVTQSPVTPPTIPTKSRARAYTAPSAEPILERIASAMIEKEKLQAEIDSIVERQSLYINSRPSTAYGVADLEPMPSIPALPAAAPSFAERVSLDDRPRTAPQQATAYTHERTIALAAAAFNSHPPQVTPSYSRVRVGVDRTGSPMTVPRQEFRNDDSFDRPLAPPLPLVLRPPLRKKKSFSRVSNWLFLPGSSPNLTTTAKNNPDDPFQERRLEISRDSVTNQPRPIKESDGFYQCIAPPNAAMSMTNTEHLYDGSGFGFFSPEIDANTVSSVSSSTWETDEEEDDDERRTVPTTTCQSPGSSPVVQNTPKHTPTIQRTATFGGKSATGISTVSNITNGTTTTSTVATEITVPITQPGLAIPVSGHRPQSVGVAF
ncbi:hypothetical protein V8F20_009475 [Naviculisporaceae sp. PSN 640]